VLKKCKKHDDVLFINAAEYYEKDKRHSGKTKMERQTIFKKLLKPTNTDLTTSKDMPEGFQSAKLKTMATTSIFRGM